MSDNFYDIFEPSIKYSPQSGQRGVSFLKLVHIMRNFWLLWIEFLVYCNLYLSRHKPRTEDKVTFPLRQTVTWVSSSSVVIKNWGSGYRQERNSVIISFTFWQTSVYRYLLCFTLKNRLLNRKVQLRNFRRDFKRGDPIVLQNSNTVILYLSIRSYHERQDNTDGPRGPTSSIP